MIKINNTIWPISHIKLIKIDWDTNQLIYYFLDEIKMPPIAVSYEDKDKLEEAVRELTNEPKSKSKHLFG